MASLPSTLTPGMPYARARSDTFGVGICFSSGTLIA
jgi:hypothetical protein